MYNFFNNQMTCFLYIMYADTFVIGIEGCKGEALHDTITLTIIFTIEY